MSKPSLGEAVLHLSGDGSKLQNDVDQAKSKVATSLSKIGGAMTSAGQKATLGLTLPLIGLGWGAINAASDLEESMNKVDVVFGSVAGSVKEFAESAAENLGLSKQKALEAAGTFGNLFTAMKIGNEDSKDMSLGLVQLAADLASFNNMDPTEVLNKLRAGMTGEAEPLKVLGVNMNQVVLAAKAMELGLIEEGEVLDAATKAQAAYAIIMEQTVVAQGDFGRTSEGLANAIRIAKAKLEDAAAVLGNQLIPYALKAVNVLSGLITKFEGLSEGNQKTIVIIGAVVAAIGPLLLILGTVISSLGAIVGVIGGPVLLVIAALAAVVALLALAWKNDWMGMQTTLKKLWFDTLLPVFIKMGAWLKENIPAAIEKLKHFWVTVLKPAIEIVWAFINDHLLPLFRALGDFLGTVFSLTLTVLAGIWQNVLQPALEDIWEFISNKLQPIFETLADFWENTLKPALENINFLDVLGEHFDRIGKSIQTVIDFIKTLTEKLKKIELPDWMTPGSPTPWEIGLIGVSKAMGEVRANIDMGLGGLAPAVAGGSAAGAPGGGGSVTHENHFHIGTLVADERGLTELERRLRPIRDTETQRRGTI